MEAINKIKEIVEDRPQVEWTIQEWHKIAKIIGYTDEEFCEGKDILDEGASIIKRLVGMIGNYIIEGDWEDYNFEASENDYNLQNVCNVAFSFIRRWIDNVDSTATDEDCEQVLSNAKLFEKETELDYEIFSDRRLIELI